MTTASAQPVLFPPRAPAHTSAIGLAAAISRLAEGRDPDAWAIVLEQAGPHLWRMVSRLSGDRALAEDAVQDALLLVRDHARTFRDPGRDSDAAALRWMMSIAANAAIGLFRKRTRKRERPLGEAEGMTTVTQAGTAMESADTMDAVRRALCELPESTRQPIVLHYLGGLRLDQVALTLGVPLGSAKVRVHRGLKRLRERLRRSGAVLSIAALSALLEQLPAMTAPDAARFSSLVGSHLAPTQGLPHRGLFQEFSMASKLALAAAVVCAIGIVPFVSGQEGAAPKAADGKAAALPGAAAPGAAGGAVAAPGAPGAGGAIAPGQQIVVVEGAEGSEGGNVVVTKDGQRFTIVVKDGDDEKPITYAGTLASHDAASIVLTVTKAGSPFAPASTSTQKLTLTDKTAVTVGGKKATAADLKDGMTISAVGDDDGVITSVSATN